MVLENRGKAPFGYVVDNQPQTILPGDSQELSGIYPPVVRFDDGAGQYKQRRLDAASYRVALGADRSLDIYPAGGRAVGTTAGSPPPAGGGRRGRTACSATDAAGAATLGHACHGFCLRASSFSIPWQSLAAPKTASTLPPAFDLFRSVALATPQQ